MSTGGVSENMVMLWSQHDVLSNVGIKWQMVPLRLEGERCCTIPVLKPSSHLSVVFSVWVSDRVPFCLNSASLPWKCRLDSSLVDCWQCYLLTLSSQTGFAHTQVICTHSVGCLKRSTVLVTPINTERGGGGRSGLQRYEQCVRVITAPGESSANHCSC